MAHSNLFKPTNDFVTDNPIKRIPLSANKVFTIAIVGTGLVLCIILLILQLFRPHDVIFLRTVFNWILGILLPFYWVAFFAGIYFGIKNFIQAANPEEKNKLYRIAAGVLCLLEPALMIKLIFYLYVYINVMSNM